jgi:hypothetical protein
MERIAYDSDLVRNLIGRADAHLSRTDVFGYVEYLLRHATVPNSPRAGGGDRRKVANPSPFR